jgi:3,4-dihydroxy 2-butanone 4-phosphate synthase/GTP cyclohydrolase II
VFPLRARKGGVLVRAGQTEASVDLARMAGLVAAGVICEIMNDDGSMARVPDLIEFCRVHGLKMLTVAELIRYRLQHERSIVRVAESMLPTLFGEFRMIAYESETDPQQSHVALVMGDVAQAELSVGGLGVAVTEPNASSGETIRSAAEPIVAAAEPTGAAAEPILVRVHTHCLAGEVFGSTLCDCRASVERSLRAIAEAGRGALVYLHNGARGFEIDRTAPKPHIALHRHGPREPRPPAETHDDRHQRILRQTGLGGQILSDLKIRRIRLMSNTPTHVPALQGFGVEIVEQVPVPEFGNLY